MTKTLLAFILFTTISHAVYSKADTISVYMKTISSNNAPSTEIVVNSKDSADFVRFVMPPDSTVNKWLYPVADYYFNGKLKLKGTSTKFTPYINLQGICIEFYPTGHKKIICSYDEGSVVGEMFQFFPNGRIYISGNFENNKFNLITCYDSTGKVLAENGNGTWVKYNKNLKEIIEEGPVVSGRENGEWKGRFNDTTSYSCIYKTGDFVSGISYDKKGNQYPFKSISVMPEFKGGINAFMKFMSKNLRYPPSASQNNIEGRVIVKFVIDKDGSLKDIHVVRGINKDLNDEAVRVLKACPPWLPGSQYGMPFRFEYIAPIEFSLTKNEPMLNWHPAELQN